MSIDLDQAKIEEMRDRAEDSRSKHLRKIRIAMDLEDNGVEDEDS